MNRNAPLCHSHQRVDAGNGEPMIKCPKCGEPHSDKIPFCIKCEGYIVLDYLISGNLLVVTYRKPNGRAQ